MTGKNTMKLPVILAVMVLISLFAVLPTLAEGDAVLEVQRAIEDTGASWTAGTTSVSGYSLEDKLRLCGAKIGQLPADAMMLTPPADRKVSYGTFDWRNVSGEDWMTSVKEQGLCGSCWVFCATGAFEAQINIDAGDPTIDFDSSEQNILSCSGGGDCEEGGWVNATLKYIRDTGVPDEECLRYRADDSIPCNDTCSDWQERAWTCERIGVPVCHRTECYKWILEDYGPMVVVLNVSEDILYSPAASMNRSGRPMNSRRRITVLCSSDTMTPMNAGSSRTVGVHSGARTAMVESNMANSRSMSTSLWCWEHARCAQMQPSQSRTQVCQRVPA